jgi:hypothetical protein
MDLSWAIIHAALNILNLETVKEYSQRIYEFAKLKTEYNPNKSFCHHVAVIPCTDSFVV